MSLEENITSAHDKITECKKEIQRAKRIRKNRQGMTFLTYLKYHVVSVQLALLPRFCYTRLTAIY